MKIVKYYCDLCGKEMKVSDMAEVSISCKWNIDKEYNNELMTCFDCWHNTIKNVVDKKTRNKELLKIL